MHWQTTFYLWSFYYGTTTTAKSARDCKEKRRDNSWGWGKWMPDRQWYI